MQIREEELEELVQQIWASILMTEVQFMPGGDVGDTALPVAASINITGDWQGTLTLECSEAMAERAASALFGTEELSDEDIEEAVAELINIVAGNMKPLLPGQCSLSLPEASAAIAPDDKTATRLTFHAQNAPSRICLLPMHPTD